ncbi:MAG: GyrI-like domain-containing protein [Methanomicrobiales archaeon]|jgi:hypothetical protein|nr:GyrI-like domain-containing protein [Methanomicrobiales archaeon]
MIDFKKDFKELYQPKTTPSIIHVPKMTFIAVDGKGNPNTSEEYATAIEVLYGLSYTIKMGNKAVLKYVVSPLEGFWSIDGGFVDGDSLAIDKDRFMWTALIRQPDFVTVEVFEAAQASLAKKKPNLDTGRARLETFTEGLCVQSMHIGPYDNEPATIAVLEQYAIENGYVLDVDDLRRHHEIYLSDPRRVAPEKLKTVIRCPVRKENT